MKSLLLTLAITTSCLFATAQTTSVISNGSFENWSTYQGSEYPTNWYVWDTVAIQNGSLAKVTNSSHGSYALHLGSYIDQGDVVGTEVEIRDTLPEPIGGLSFDYRVQNNNTQFVNGLAVYLFYYDTDGHYITEISWSTPFLTNNSTYQTKILPYDSPTDARSFLLWIFYANADGGINEFAEIDNVKFQDFGTGTNLEPTQSKLQLYPNPSSGFVTIDGISSYAISSIIITDVYGRTYSLEPTTTLDLSDFAGGLYMVEFFDTNKNLVQSSKVVIK